MHEHEHHSFVVDATPDGAYTLSVHINGQAVRVKYRPKDDEELALLAAARHDNAPVLARVRAGVFLIGVRARS